MEAGKAKGSLYFFFILAAAVVVTVLKIERYARKGCLKDIWEMNSPGDGLLFYCMMMEN